MEEEECYDVDNVDEPMQLFNPSPKKHDQHEKFEKKLEERFQDALEQIVNISSDPIVNKIHLSTI